MSRGKDDIYRRARKRRHLARRRQICDIAGRAGGIKGLLEAIATAAETDKQISEGKALSEREEAVLQALELMTRGQEGTIWIKAAGLRERVARLIGQPVEKMGDAQWIGHILMRLHLIDEAGRKRGMDGIAYAVRSFDVIDMMRRYDVATIHETR